MVYVKDMVDHLNSVVIPLASPVWGTCINGQFSIFDVEHTEEIQEEKRQMLMAL